MKGDAVPPIVTPADIKHRQVLPRLCHRAGRPLLQTVPAEALRPGGPIYKGIPKRVKGPAVYHTLLAVAPAGFRRIQPGLGLRRPLADHDPADPFDRPPQ